MFCGSCPKISRKEFTVDDPQLFCNVQRIVSVIRVGDEQATVSVQWVTQPLASVTVTVNVAVDTAFGAVKLTVWAVALAAGEMVQAALSTVHLYEYRVVPPVTLAVNVQPLLPATTSLFPETLHKSVSGWVIVPVVVEVHPFLSVTVYE